MRNIEDRAPDFEERPKMTRRRRRIEDRGGGGGGPMRRSEDRGASRGMRRIEEENGIEDRGRISKRMISDSRVGESLRIEEEDEEYRGSSIEKENRGGGSRRRRIEEEPGSSSIRNFMIENINISARWWLYCEGLMAGAADPGSIFPCA